MIDKFYSVKKATPWFAVFSGFFCVLASIIICVILLFWCYHWCYYNWCYDCIYFSCFLVFSCFLQHECHGFERVLFTLRSFQLTLLSHIRCVHYQNLFFLRVPWEPTVQPQWQQGLIMWLKTKFWSSCLFESHSNSET